MQGLLDSLYKIYTGGLFLKFLRNKIDEYFYAFWNEYSVLKMIFYVFLLA